MEIVKISEGKQFLKKGDRVKNLYVILNGNVKAYSKNDEFGMEPGSIIGMMESASGVYLCDYTTETECTFYEYPYSETEDYKKIFLNEGKYVAVFTMAAVRQTFILLKRYMAFFQMAHEYYEFLVTAHEEYKRLCNDYQVQEINIHRLNSVIPVQLPARIEAWTIEYYEKMAEQTLKAMDERLLGESAVGIGEMLNAAGWMKEALSLIENLKEYLQLQKEALLSSNGEDLFYLFFDLAKRSAHTGADLEPILGKIADIMEYARRSQLYSDKLMDLRFTAYENRDFYQVEFEDTEVWNGEDIAEEGEDQKTAYLQQILSYSDYDEEKAEAFCKKLEEYKALPDMLSTSDDVRTLRRELSKHFYAVYELAFWHSLENDYIPSAIKMFLNFGFMDDGMAGEDNANSLYDLTKELSQCKAENVFTMYEWLLSIYRGENEPSRNEFDMDYAGFLNEQKKTGRITVNQVKELSINNRKKVEYEMKNMFISTNRATYGKVSTFCAILHEDDIINSVENMLVTAEKINEAITAIRRVDFSVFYREIIFSDPARDITRELVQQEVLPYIILMPNAGNRAMMWQETAGIKKDTPARFIFPVMTVADVTEMMIEACGRYRWEMCRKIQGIRWNDISEASLTSEYSDYIQYYRKNRDLTVEAREKIKNLLYKSKNNYREVFVKDYQNWIKYESKGSFRLNKVSRDIIFRYCPFSQEIRRELGVNPMYREIFEKYQIIKERKMRHMELWYDRYQKKGGEMVSQLQVNRDFYDL